jgi:hypothetical protein
MNEKEKIIELKQNKDGVYEPIGEVVINRPKEKKQHNNVSVSPNLIINSVVENIPTKVKRSNLKPKHKEIAFEFFDGFKIGLKLFEQMSKIIR